MVEEFRLAYLPAIGPTINTGIDCGQESISLFQNTLAGPKSDSGRWEIRKIKGICVQPWIINLIWNATYLKIVCLGRSRFGRSVVLALPGLGAGTRSKIATCGGWERSNTNDPYFHSVASSAAANHC
jgi:hypothetical protein